MIQLLNRSVKKKKIQLTKGCPFDYNDNGYYDEYDEGYRDGILDDQLDQELDTIEDLMDMLEEYGMDHVEGYIDANMQEWEDQQEQEFLDSLQEFREREITPDDIEDIEEDEEINY